MTTYAEQERHGGEYDVIVVGGGVAGVSAAVAAARSGVRTLLIEKTIALGGLATIGLISWYEPLCDGGGYHMAGGIAEELLRVCIRYGFDDLPESWVKKTGDEPREGRYATHYSPTMAIMALDEFIRENNVALRFDTWATLPVMEGRVCKGVICESAGGREFFAARVVIDATGDASVFHRAGAPTELGDNYLSFVAHYTDREIAGQFAIGGKGAKARRWISAGSNLYGAGHPEGMPMQRCETGDDVTDFVLKGRGMLFEKLKDGDRESRDVTMLPMMPQYRKIRRLVGAYTFQGNEDNMEFDDAVGSMGDFRARGRRFQLPYRCLYHRDYSNMLAAGRIISAAGDGWEITRVIPVAALSGHAAGAAAAAAVKEGEAVDRIDIPALRKTLERQGVLFRT